MAVLDVSLRVTGVLLQARLSLYRRDQNLDEVFQ
jgi:hypothetical protein